MKIKLLKKVRRTVRLYERNGLYYIGLDNMMTEGIEKKEEAINEYRYRVVARARRIFGFKPKYRLF